MIAFPRPILLVVARLVALVHPVAGQDPAAQQEIADASLLDGEAAAAWLGHPVIPRP